MRHLLACPGYYATRIFKFKKEIVCVRLGFGRCRTVCWLWGACYQLKHLYRKQHHECNVQFGIGVF
jgi:hypothetical protein